MPALTPRVLQRNVRSTKLARGIGASYGFDLVVESGQPSEQIIAKGLSTFGGGITPFGGELMSSMDGSGLYPFGSGIMTMGTGLVPFGMGFLSKLKGFAKKATSTITGSTPAQLKRMALDLGKKKARELLPKVVAKVKTEIAQQAPKLAVRLTDPLVGKLPEGMKDNVSAMVKYGLDKGLSKIDTGLTMGEKRASELLSGSGIPMWAHNEEGPLMLKKSQLDYMKKTGAHDDMSRKAGEIPKRLVLDQHSRSLADTILANKKYQQVKQQELAQMYGMSGGQLGYHMDMPSVSDLKTVKVPGSARKKAAGRPKGTGMRGKGIVYM